MKYSIRNFFITLIMAAIVFSVCAFFLIQTAEGFVGDVFNGLGNNNKKPTETTPEATPAPTEYNIPSQKLTCLFVGVDEYGRNADAIILFTLDKSSKTMLFLTIPANTAISIDNRNYTLGSFYKSRSVTYLSNVAWSLTGITADYYVILNMEGLEKIIDAIGGIKFNVPVSMHYSDPAQSLYINIKAGEQTLNGKKALQVLRFKNYTNDVEGRDNLHLDFIKSFCESFLQPKNILTAQNITDTIYRNIDTNITPELFLQNINYFFDFASYETSFEKLPGNTVSDNGEYFYKPDVKYSLERYAKYK